MFYFDTRSKAREYAKLSGGQLVDNGPDAPKGRRWAVRVFVFC